MSAYDVQAVEGDPVRYAGGGAVGRDDLNAVMGGPGHRYNVMAAPPGARGVNTNEEPAPAAQASQPRQSGGSLLGLVIVAGLLWWAFGKGEK